MRILGKLLALSLLLGGLAQGAEAGGFSLVLDSGAASPAETAALQAFLRGVEEKIPSAMRSAIGQPVRIRFSKLSSEKALPLPSCSGQLASPGSRMDKRRGIIFVDELLKPEILAGPEHSRMYPCGHRSLYALAQAAIVHSLAHLYDSTLGSRQSTRDSRFQKLMGFSEQWSWNGFLFRALKAKNHLTLRSPDPVEFQNIREGFAVNFEYFILDPEFGCRRPSVDHHFRELLGDLSSPTCQANTIVFENSNNTDRNLKFPVDLDPSRIYDVHYFVASEGTALMSHWGHGMYRLIVCAPERKEVGPECLNDVQYHVILSYRANVQDLVLSYSKGLFGGYPSQLYILPLAEILTEYNELELRNVESIPLELTTEQKEQFVERVLEQYWEYQGRYYFITNNCATEALHLLQGIVDSKRLNDLSEFSPIQMEHDLAKIGLSDESVLKDMRQSATKGYYFASKAAALDAAFAQIRNVLKDPGSLGLGNRDDYVKKTSSEKRLALFHAVVDSAPNENRPKLIANFLLLESYISAMLQDQFGSEVSKQVQSSDDSSAAKLDQSLIQALRSDQPWERLSSGYGIPQARDFDPARIQSLATQKADALQKVQAWMKLNFKSELDEIARVEDNQNLFRNELVRGNDTLHL